MSSVKTLLNGVNRRNLTSNTQKAAFRLLSANGQWLSRGELSRTISSAAARVRDLRKPEFGGFTVECASAVTLDKRGTHNTFFYRIPPKTVKKTQVNTVFRV